MLRKTNTGYRPIIIDLGMAEYIDQQTYLFDKCGTPGYAAPEMFIGKSKSPQKCDIFSLGVIFYAMYFEAYLDCFASQYLSVRRRIKSCKTIEMEKWFWIWKLWKKIH